MQSRNHETRSLFFSLLLAYMTILIIPIFIILLSFYEKKKTYINSYFLPSSQKNKKKIIHNKISVNTQKKKLSLVKNSLNNATADYLFNMHFKNTVKDDQKIKLESREKSKTKQSKISSLPKKKKIIKEQEIIPDKKINSKNATKKKETETKKLPSIKAPSSEKIKKEILVQKSQKNENFAQTTKKNTIEKKHIPPLDTEIVPVKEEEKRTTEYYTDNSKASETNTEGESQQTEENNIFLNETINIDGPMDRAPDTTESELEEDLLNQVIRHYFNRIQKHIALFPHKKKNIKITYSKNKNNDLALSFDRPVPIAYKMHIMKTLKDIPLPPELINKNIITSL